MNLRIIAITLLIFSVFSCIKKSETIDKVSEKNAANVDPNSQGAFHFSAPCVSCHASARPAIPHDQENDCVGCHAYPDWTSSISSFNHDPAPDNCIACHEKDRPVAPHPTEGDCVSCHAYPKFNILIGDAQFSHEPKPEACEACHTRPETGNRSYPNQGPPSNFDENDPFAIGSGHYLGKDCLSCHNTPAEGATSFTFNHSTPKADICLPCHFNDGDEEHNDGNRIMLQGLGNCFSCHQNFDRNDERNWGRINGGGDD